MRPFQLRRSALVFVAVAGIAAPAHVHAQGARARGSAPVQGQAVPRGQAAPQSQVGAPRQAPVQRQAAPQRQAPPQRQVMQAPVQGMQRMPQQTAPSAAAGQRRLPPPAAVAPRVPTARAFEAPARQAVPRTVPRVVVPQTVVPRAGQPRVGVVNPYDHRVYRPDYRPNYRPGYRVDSRYYRSYYRPSFRPYYVFTPRIRLAFGLWVGYPVKYPYYVRPYQYPYPYTYTYPAPYPYPLGTVPYPVYTAPVSINTATLGGLSFEITPGDAEIYIDGQYYGTVDQFAPTQPPLWLPSGRHRVEIQKAGYETVAFDVDIVAGQVIPYQGDLRTF
jgi:hypothetical protein